MTNPLLGDSYISQVKKTQVIMTSQSDYYHIISMREKKAFFCKFSKRNEEKDLKCFSLAYSALCYSYSLPTDLLLLKFAIIFFFSKFSCKLFSIDKKKFHLITTNEKRIFSLFLSSI